MTYHRIIAIGDIHGCAESLEALLAAIAPTADDLVIPLGDVVDRGPSTRRVVELLLDLRDRCALQPIMGNHEEMMLRAVSDTDAAQSWIRFGGFATLDSYGFQGTFDVLPEAHLDFLKGFADFVETDDHFFVHANYAHDAPLDEQTPEMLRWKHLDEHLPPPHQSGKAAVVGHSADPSGEVVTHGHLTCIDTFCYGGGPLTALDVVSGKTWQTPGWDRLNG